MDSLCSIALKEVAVNGFFEIYAFVASYPHQHARIANQDTNISST
jgi:hypothetical protein